MGTCTALSQQAGRCATLSNTRHPNVQETSPARMPGFQSQTSPGFAGRSLKSLPAQRPLLASAHMPQSAEPNGRPMPASLTQQVSCSCHLPRIMSCSRGIVHSHLADRVLEKRAPVGVPCRLNVGTCISFYDAWSVSVQEVPCSRQTGRVPCK